MIRQVFGCSAAIAAAALLPFCANAQATACYTYDQTGRLTKAEYSDGSEIIYAMDRNDNFTAIDQAPTGAATCATPSVDPALVPLAGGDLGSGSGGSGGGGSGGGGSGGGGSGGGNQSPTATEDTGMVQKFNSVTINALLNDSDPDNDTLTITAVTQPLSGTATIINNGGAIQYSAGGAADEFTFQYTISDGNGGSDTALVTVTVFGSGPGGGLEL